ncbi:MAG: hypothetical protein HY904_00330 [Deltaproteobacteria bacterium]|nr:hypothetical protein [Deltaproteobacteria bacterium]
METDLRQWAAVLAGLWVVAGCAGATADGTGDAGSAATSSSRPSGGSSGASAASSSAAAPAPCVEWIFDGTAAPFTLDNALALAGTQSAGEVTLQATGGDPFMSAPATADLGRCTVVELTYEVPAGTAGSGQIFWLRTTDAGYFTEAQGQFFPLTPGGIATYRVDMAGHALWNGTLQRLRFDPFNAAASSFRLRSIRVLDATQPPASSSAAPRVSSSSSSAAPPPSCTTPLAQRLRVTAVPVTGATVDVGSDDGWATNRPIHVEPLPDGTARVAWSDTAGSVHVTPLTASDTRAGADVTVAGESVRGFVAHEDGTNALLVVRGDDLFFVKLSSTGTLAVETQLVGQLPQDQDGAKYVHFWGHQGRLRWNGTAYHAYFGHNQNFGPTTGTHQGDVFYLLDAAGQPAGGWWDWGCSHSLDVRLAVTGTTVGAVCLSDAYPVKAVLFNHYTQIHAEPSGNMAGSSDARLGGLVGVDGGFALTFASPEGRCATPEADGGCPAGRERDVAFARLDVQGSTQQLAWITQTPGVAEYAPRLGRLGGTLLATWKEGTMVKAVTLDPDGAVTEGPVNLEVDYAAKDDISTASNGDAVWAHAAGYSSELRVMRVAACR